MSFEAEDRKRKDRLLDEDDVNQEREKQMREKSPEVTLAPPALPHVSIMNAPDLQSEAKTPVPVSKKTPQPIRLLEKCKVMMGIDGSPPQSLSLA